MQPKFIRFSEVIFMSNPNVPTIKSGRVFGIDSVRHNSGNPSQPARVSVTSISVKRQALSAQASQYRTDATGRRYRPSEIIVLQKAPLVLRQVEESDGDIISVARNHEVPVNAIGKAMVMALRERALAVAA